MNKVNIFFTLSSLLSLYCSDVQAVYLSNIDCRVEGFSNIHDDVSPDDVMVAGQAVDLDDGAGGPVGEVAERLAAVRLEAGNRF